MRTLLMLFAMLVPPTGDWLSLVDRVSGRNVVEVYNYSTSTECTGEVVDFNQVLTADHCVRSYTNEMFVSDQFGNVHPATPVKRDHLYDLALIDAGLATKSPIKLAAASPEPGEEVMAIGYHKGQGSLFGVIQRIVPNYLVTSFGLPHGYSGGPLFNHNGELVGVNVRSDGINGWTVPVERVKLFLKSKGDK